MPPRQLLSDPDERVRAYAAVATGLDDDPGALAEVRAALRDPAAIAGWFEDDEDPQQSGWFLQTLIQALLRRTTTFEDVSAEATVIAAEPGGYARDRCIEDLLPGPRRPPRPVCASSSPSDAREPALRVDAVAAAAPRHARSVPGRGPLPPRPHRPATRESTLDADWPCLAVDPADDRLPGGGAAALIEQQPYLNRTACYGLYVRLKMLDDAMYDLVQIVPRWLARWSLTQGWIGVARRLALNPWLNFYVQDGRAYAAEPGGTPGTVRRHGTAVHAEPDHRLPVASARGRRTGVAPAFDPPAGSGGCRQAPRRGGKAGCVP